MKPLHPINFTTAHHPWDTDALINWCEADFAVVPFIAEFFNTISNGWVFLLASFGLYNAWMYGYERRFAAAYAALLVVGIGSMMFHATLRYHMQLLDELPMLFGSSVLIYCSIQPTKPRPWWPVSVAAAVYPTVIAALYMRNRVAEFFQVGYGVQVAVIFYLVCKNTAFFGRNAYETAAGKVNGKVLNGTSNGRSGKAAAPVPVIQDEGRVLCWMALGFYLVAFSIWVAENALCYSHFVPMKEVVGWPANALLEGHAWWHLFSYYASYVATTYMVAVRAVSLPPPATNGTSSKLRSSSPAKPRASAIAWMGPVPYVVLGAPALALHSAKLKAN